VQEEQEIAAGRRGAGVHLGGTATRRAQNAVRMGCGETGRAVRTVPVDDQGLAAGRADRRECREGRDDALRLVEGRDDDGDDRMLTQRS
jgi:hypothetical protein